MKELKYKYEVGEFRHDFFFIYRDNDGKKNDYVSRVNVDDLDKDNLEEYLEYFTHRVLKGAKEGKEDE